MVVPFAPKSEEIWTDWVILQPIPFKSDRLLDRDAQVGIGRCPGRAAFGRMQK